MGGQHFIHFMHFMHLIHFIRFIQFILSLHFIYFIHHSNKGKGKVRHGKRKKGKLATAKGKQEKEGTVFWVRVPLGNQTARTHARTDDTKRNDFPIGLVPQPPIRMSDGSSGTIMYWRLFRKSINSTFVSHRQ